MSTGTIEETQAVEDFSIPTHMRCNSCDFTKPNGDPSPCPEGHVSGFTRADEGENEAAEAGPVDEILAEAVEQEQPEAKRDDEDRRRSVAVRLAEDNLFARQDELGLAIKDHATKDRVAKDAKKKVETMQTDVYMAISELRKARYGELPDPGRYPLFDEAKAEINGLFPAPEAIQPLPPDTFAEALRRKQQDTPLLSMGFKAGTLKVLTEKHGLKTALDLVNKVTEYGRRNMDFSRADGITELRFEEVADKLEELTGEWEAAWKAAHPDDEIPRVEPDGEEQALIRETFAALVSVGHTQEQANAMVKRAWDTGKRFASVSEAVDAIYLANQQDDE